VTEDEHRRGENEPVPEPRDDRSDEEPEPGWEPPSEPTVGNCFGEEEREQEREPEPSGEQRVEPLAPEPGPWDDRSDKELEPGQEPSSDPTVGNRGEEYEQEKEPEPWDDRSDEEGQPGEEETVPSTNEDGDQKDNPEPSDRAALDEIDQEPALKLGSAPGSALKPVSATKDEDRVDEDYTESGPPMPPLIPKALYCGDDDEVAGVHDEGPDESRNIRPAASSGNRARRSKRQVTAEANCERKRAEALASAIRRERAAERRHAKKVRGVPANTVPVETRPANSAGAVPRGAVNQDTATRRSTRAAAFEAQSKITKQAADEAKPISATDDTRPMPSARAKRPRPATGAVLRQVAGERSCFLLDFLLEYPQGKMGRMNALNGEGARLKSWWSIGRDC
jgi:hypothetical protein